MSGADSLSGKAFTALSTIGYAFLYLLVLLSLTARPLRHSGQARRNQDGKRRWRTLSSSWRHADLAASTADYRIYGLYE
ncbi:MAG: hypothetical protein M5R42_20090 [Rhodocyclaceae bacterium]|nr:hypothetical protein [Rhodocyclaceae bacterium]